MEDQQTQEQEIEKVKVGEKEYTSDELNRLVGLGEIAREAEERYNRPISKFWPEYTKTNQELEKTKAELEELRRVATKPQEQLTDQDKILQEAKEQLKKLGYIPADEVDQRARAIAAEVVSGYKLLDRIDSFVSAKASEGLPKTTSEDLLGYMQENNLKDPEIAYKIKFEKELDAIKEKKLTSLRPSGLVTEGRSTAGGKQPAPVRVTKDNLQEVLTGYLRG